MRKTALTALSIVVLALVGCSDPEPYDQVHDGVLEDGDERVDQDDSPYDEYTFRAGKGWTVTVEMRSDEFDTFLWLFGPDGSLLVHDDQVPGERTDSRITHVAPSRGTYTVWANSYDATGRGPYTLHIMARPAN
ncbi:MAG TPA: hypothetical protein VIL20_24905 [Sandaracinaceae bacterium]